MIPNFYRPILSNIYYPQNPEDLERYFLSLQENKLPLLDIEASSILLPHSKFEHAGPIYYNLLSYLKNAFDLDENKKKDTIFILGHGHHYYFQGLTLPLKSYFQTPIGISRVNYKLQSELLELPYFVNCWDYLGPEQSTEVLIPWLRFMLPKKMILPIIIGEMDEFLIAQLIQQYWDEGIFIFTSDLSLEKEYGKGLNLDRFTSRSIEALDGTCLTKDHLCGVHVVRAFLMVAQERGLKAKTIDLKVTSDFESSLSYSKGVGGYIFYK